MSRVRESASNKQDIRKQNLKFFEVKFLNAGLGVHPPSLAPLQLSTAHSIGVIESTLWLKLGIELDFFDPADVGKKLLSIEHELMSFWERIEGLPQIEQWCDFLTTEKGFDKERFFHAVSPNHYIEHVGIQSRQLGPEGAFWKHRERMKQLFFTHLLLASETIFDSNTTHFLDTISDQRTKQLEQLRGDVYFYFGFANHLRYLTDFYEFVYPNPCGDDAEEKAIDALDSRIRNIVQRRIIIDSEPARTRCFELSGDLMSSIKRPEPEWFAMRDSVFLELDWVTRSTESTTNEDRVRYNRDLRALFLAHSDGLKVGFRGQADIASVE